MGKTLGEKTSGSVIRLNYQFDSFHYLIEHLQRKNSNFIEYFLAFRHTAYSDKAYFHIFTQPLIKYNYLDYSVKNYQDQNQMAQSLPIYK